MPEGAAQGLCPKCLLMQALLPTEAGKASSSRPVPPTREEIAAAFPQLEILELIGQGGMGFVFKARQPKLDRLVALKILPQSLAADPAFAERFTREGRVLAKLNHPNIVTVHDFGLSNNYFYLLMEYVDGVNLRQAMKANQFTPAQALAIVPKICEALQYAHNEGVLHRDIKPENILLDSKGRVKIADFGIAKLAGEAQADLSLTATGYLLGTPSYMAPEQIENTGSVDHRADIYSLGVVFYEMLTGGLPIGHFALPSEKSYVDPRLDEVVLRTLEKDRERRTQTADEVKTQVETIAASAPAAAPPAKPSPLPTAQPASDRFWRRFGITVLVFIAALVGIYMATGLVVRERARATAERLRREASARPTEFEISPKGVYTAGSGPEDWTVISNEVSVVTDPQNAHRGANYLALANGRIAKTFAVEPGATYQLRFYARGPGITDWWPGDGNANDIIGPNNGTVQNVTFNAGEVSQAFHFQGQTGSKPKVVIGDDFLPADSGVHRQDLSGANQSSSEVDFDETVANFGTNDFTIDFWIREPVNTKKEFALLEKRSVCNATVNSFSIHSGPVIEWNEPAAGQLAFEVTGDDNENLAHFVSKGKIDDGKFHHATFVRNDLMLSIYIDGELDSTITTPGIANIDNTAVFRAGQSVCVRPGVGGFDQDLPFQGDMDELRLFNRALSPAEIRTSYNAGMQGKKNPVSVLPSFELSIPGLATKHLFEGNPSGPWRDYSCTFVAQTSETTLEFAGNAPGVLLDDIRIGPETDDTTIINQRTDDSPLPRRPISFARATNGALVMDNWTVTGNAVDVATDPNQSPHTAYLALADSRITKTFHTLPGTTYRIEFTARGPGLTDWWPGDGNANDVIGGHNGTLKNVSFTGGQVNQAFHFRGGHGQVLVPNFISSQQNKSEVDFGRDAGNFGTNDFTVDFWINLPPSATGEIAVLDKREICDSTRSLWDVRCGHTWVVDPSKSGQLFMDVTGDNIANFALVVANKPINDGVFHHAAFVRNGLTLTVYIDGILDNSVTTRGIANLTNNDMFMAGQSACVGTDGTEPFPGDLDELDLFNRALSPAEIRAIYLAGSAGKYSHDEHGAVTPWPAFQVTVDGIATNTYTVSNALKSDSWSIFTREFTADKSEVQIEFAGNPLGVLLDDIALVPSSDPQQDAENKKH